MNSPKNFCNPSGEEIHRSYLLAKTVRREFDGLKLTLNDIEKTVKRMLDKLEDWEKNSKTFWTQYRRDFPEMCREGELADRLNRILGTTG